MQDACLELQSTAGEHSRELYRCDDLKLARTVATCVAAMEFDVRLCSINPLAGAMTIDDDAQPATQYPPNDSLPGPHVIEVPANVWRQLAEVLGEIIAEQREFDEMLEWRQGNRVRIIIVLSVATAAEIALIWRLLEA